MSNVTVSVLYLLLLLLHCFVGIMAGSPYPIEVMKKVWSVLCMSAVTVSVVL